MTSLDHDHEHEVQNTANTNSDCDWDCWDADNWGDMEQQPSVMSGHGISNVSPSPHSPKANNQWTSLEEEPVRTLKICYLYYSKFKCLITFTKKEQLERWF